MTGEHQKTVELPVVSRAKSRWLSEDTEVADSRRVCIRDSRFRPRLDHDLDLNRPIGSTRPTATRWRTRLCPVRRPARDDTQASKRPAESIPGSSDRVRGRRQNRPTPHLRELPFRATLVTRSLDCGAGDAARALHDANAHIFDLQARRESAPSTSAME